jgi:hypothetical protein
MQPFSIDRQRPVVSSQPAPSSSLPTHEVKVETKLLLLAGLPIDDIFMCHFLMTPFKGQGQGARAPRSEACFLYAAATAR